MKLTDVIYIVAVLSTVEADPSFCTYSSNDLEYTCDSQTWTLPMTLGSFSNVPQSITIINVNGELPGSGTFSGFSSINSGSFDANSVPTLAIRCVASGQLIITSGSFTDMNYIQELFIINCEILALPDEVFSQLQTLNYLRIEGTSIGDIGFDVFKGLDIYPMAVRNPKGTLSIWNANLDGEQIPNGALFALSNVVNIEIDNSNLKTLQKDMFRALTKVKFISLSRNPFQILPTGMFDGLNALGHVEMYGILWNCTCSDIWFPEFFKSSNVTLGADLVCTSPDEYIDKRYALYEKAVCPQNDACYGMSGILMKNGTYCLTYEQIGNHCFGGIILILAIVSLILVIHLRRQLNEADAMPKQKFEFTGRKLSGSNWQDIPGDVHSLPDPVEQQISNAELDIEDDDSDNGETSSHMSRETTNMSLQSNKTQAVVETRPQSRRKNSSVSPSPRGDELSHL